mmetsp:Transcript_3443/g.10551  ORF Transcript_3443/g.10551 Transcript_3443/m.10551 type:complete len:212 (-) Transcript_3443:297-932(-)
MRFRKAEEGEQKVARGQAARRAKVEAALGLGHEDGPEHLAADLARHFPLAVLVVGRLGPNVLLAALPEAVAARLAPLPGPVQEGLADVLAGVAALERLGGVLEPVAAPALGVLRGGGLGLLAAVLGPPGLGAASLLELVVGLLALELVVREQRAVLGVLLADVAHGVALVVQRELEHGVLRHGLRAAGRVDGFDGHALALQAREGDVEVDG